MPILILAILLGLIPAIIAKNKGRSFIGFWIYGSLLFIVALPHALIMKPSQAGIDAQAAAAGHKKCPYCAEMVKAEATFCRFCGKQIVILPS